MNHVATLPRIGAALCLVCAWLARVTLGGDVSGPQADSPNEALGQVDFHQNVGDVVPGDITLINEHGERVALGDIAGDKPVLLLMGYYRCQMLCEMVLQNLRDTVDRVPYAPGEDYEIVFISVDPRETPEQALQKAESIVGGSHDGWHLLTGEQSDIHRVADAIGFEYAYDVETGQYAHPAGAVVLTPGMQIARYLFGMRFAARDVKFAIIEASRGEVGSAVDQVLLRCYSYDPATGQYGFSINAALNIAATVTVLGLATMVGMLSYKHRRQRLTLGREKRSSATRSTDTGGRRA